jgi:ATPase subunit of ABC transporter with duplicated ATPase domains
MRVALARILLMAPDAMLLDEPSNHLDIESLIWLEGFLAGFEGALLMTSHDRAFMNRVVNKIIEIDGGELTSYSGDYEFYARQRELNDRHLQAQFERQQAMLAKEIRFIERFKARASHAAQVQSRVKKLEKIDRVEPPRRRQTVAFDFPPAPRSGDDVVVLRNVAKRYGHRVLYADFDFRIRRRERWCVMGVNGAGTSTLLKLVAGASPIPATSPSAAASSSAISRSTRWSCWTETARSSNPSRTASRARGRDPCGRWRGVSGFRATTSRNAAASFQAARRRGS